MVVVGEEAAVIVAVDGPLTCVHTPVPEEGVLPLMVALPPVEQMVWSGPALAAVGGATREILTWSLDAVHGALVMVHWYT